MINRIQIAIQMAVPEKMSNELCRLVTHCQRSLMQRELLSSFSGPFFLFSTTNQRITHHYYPAQQQWQLDLAPLDENIPPQQPGNPKNNKRGLALSTGEKLFKKAESKNYLNTKMQQSTLLKTTTTTTTTTMKKSNSAKNMTDG
jgi:hypothetical protein